MKNYLNFKIKLQKLNDIQEIIKTTEKISASNILFLKKDVFVLRTYKLELEQLLNRFLSFYGFASHPFLSRKNSKKSLIIVGGEKGLVGELWHNLVNQFLNRKNEYQEIFVIGKKIYLLLQEEKLPVKKFFSFTRDIPSYEEVDAIFQDIAQEFLSGKIGLCQILFPRFISLTRQDPELLTILPFRFENSYRLTKKPFGYPIIEPSKRIFFENILRLYIRVSFYQLILESKLSEFAARMISCENSSTKTKELIKEVRLDYFKERRANITKEQLENFISIYRYE